MIEEKRKVRGTFKKQLYESQENDRERKKRETKRILDEQMQQRRKNKQLQIQKIRLQQQKEQEQIKHLNYLNEGKDQNSIKKQINQKNRKIFVQTESKQKQQYQHAINKRLSNVASQKMIPLLNLNKENENSKILTNKNQKDIVSIDGNGQSHLKSTFIQDQNKKLREELQKNNLAIEFLMGVMKTHNKFNRYTQYAEKFLNNKDGDLNKQIQNEKSKGFLPMIKSNNHKSLLHQRLKNTKNKQQKQNKKISNFM